LDPASNLNEGATYTATITTQAKDVSGNALANNETWTFTTAISAPTGLTAKQSGAASKQRIDLNWNDNSSVENRYVIERSTTPGFTSNVVTASVGANVRTYRDTAVARSTTYYYRVYAVSSTQVESDKSNVATVTTKK
jgi:fibronectin type 3 domain-containing protein